MVDMKCSDQVAVSYTNERHCRNNGQNELSLENQYEYDPHDHGYTSHPVNYRGAVMHVICTAAGSGILILPYAFQKVGYGLGILGMILVSSLYVTNVHVLLAVEYQLCKMLKVPNLTFVGVVNHGFGQGTIVLRAFKAYFKSLVYVYYGVPMLLAVYLIIIAQYTSVLWQNYYQMRPSYVESISYVSLPLIVLCSVPKLKSLVPLSMTTNVFILVAAIIISLYSLDTDAWIRNANLVQDVSFLPTFVAIALQSIKATGIILPLKSDMNHPRSLAAACGVINVSFALIIPLFGSFGLIGCLNYGNQVEDDILLNMPHSSPFTATVYTLYTLALTVSFALMAYVTFDTIWSNVLGPRLLKSSDQRIGKFILRISIVMFAYVIAIVIPDFTLISSIIGTIGVMVEIVLPSTLQLLLLYSGDNKPVAFRYMVLKNLIIVLFAAVLFCMSIRDCISDLIDLYSPNSDVSSLNK